MTTYVRGSRGWWMDERRGELDLTLDEVAAKAGVSTETLRQAANGRRMRTNNKKKIERALEWEPGSIDAIDDGGRPTPISPRAEPAGSHSSGHDEAEPRTKWERRFAQTHPDETRDGLAEIFRYRRAWVERYGGGPDDDIEPGAEDVTSSTG